MRRQIAKHRRSIN